MKHNKTVLLLSVILFLVAFKLSYSINEGTASEHGSKCIKPNAEQVWIEGKTFTMGDDQNYREERPAHKVTVDGFWIDAHEVTNAQFREFIEDTGYVTVSERIPNPEEIPGAPPEMLKPGSGTFTPPGKGERITSWWSYTPGANWKHPDGPGSSIEGMDNYPVIHISFEDAQTYAKWAGRNLPTEAQFELASRSKKEKETYAWGGDKVVPDEGPKANTWQGFFPIQNTKEDGFEGIAPVGCYDPNDYGAYDMIGNVWEWTANWYAPKHNPKDNDNPKGPKEEDSYDKNSGGFPVRVIKGGSFLCAPNFCYRYRPAARHAQDTGLGASHIGFRTVQNTKDNKL
jgi:formylglycine-generating enzyme required for sulfatase activity